MKTIITGLIIGIAIFILWLTFVSLTDKICDKTYSPEFKQTEQYKSMKCPVENP